MTFPNESRDSVRSYRLMRCNGFRVEGVDGCSGVVLDIRFARRHHQPDFLGVRFGRVRHRSVLVPVEQVAEIDTAARIVHLRLMRETA